jgi:hypothetical protein
MVSFLTLGEPLFFIRPGGTPLYHEWKTRAQAAKREKNDPVS